MGGMSISLQALPLRGRPTLASAKGKNPVLHLSLFRCIRCKSTGSTWVKEKRTPRCGLCYEEGCSLLPDDTTHIDSRAAASGAILAKEGSWE